MINGYITLNIEKHFPEDGPQNYLVFQPAFKHFQTFIGSDKIFAWIPKESSEESLKTPITPDNAFAPKLAFIHNETIGAKLQNCLIKIIYLLFIEMH